MLVETLKVTFCINGDFITQLAREKCYIEGKYDYAIELLTSVLQCDQLTENEIINLAIAILDGRARIKGTYPHDDYGYEYLEIQDNNWNLSKLINEKTNEVNKLRKLVDELLGKLNFINENLSAYEKKEISNLYYSEFNKSLFDNETIKEDDTTNIILDNWIKRHKLDMDFDNEYGWLEPNGTFHTVEWGKHNAWAEKYIKENIIFDENEYVTKIGIMGAGDYLINRGWVLLHSPEYGLARITKNPILNFTKQQKEFLYDYYIKRNCKDKANKIWQE